MFFDWTYIVLVPGILLALYAQASVQGTFAKFSRINGRRGYKADEIARDILKKGAVSNVPVEPVAGSLSDHYDPRNRVLRLSEPVYGSTSIAAIAVAAHEAGHAMQHATNYMPLKIRNVIAPISSFASWLGPIILIAGIIFQAIGLVHLGIIVFTLAVLFTVITLPVEFDASRRAMIILDQQGYLEGEELTGAHKVLRAAAMTYVASTLMAILQLLRFILLARSRD